MKIERDCLKLRAQVTFGSMMIMSVSASVMCSGYIHTQHEHKFAILFSHQFVGSPSSHDMHLQLLQATALELPMKIEGDCLKSRAQVTFSSLLIMSSIVA